MQLLIGLLLGLLIAFLAYKFGALDRSGMAAAAITGGLIFGLGGLPWTVVLLFFFLSSSWLSRAFHNRKGEISEKYAKGSRRDYGQVLANGGVGVLLACLSVIYPGQAVVWYGFIGSMAAVTADTWATELGVLSSAEPRLITRWQPVERGTSGGVTTVGYLAAFSGALAVGLCAYLVSPNPSLWYYLVLGAASGLGGATIDSLLGSTFQGIYFCPHCQKETESHPIHRCGTATSRVRGLRWLNNDLVNLVCASVGAGLAILIYRVLV